MKIKQQVNRIENDYQLVYSVLKSQQFSYVKSHQAAFAEGHLSQKTKELLAMAMAIILKEEKDACAHLKQAIILGLNPAELKELTNLILIVNGSGTMELIASILKNAEELFIEYH